MSRGRWCRICGRVRPNERFTGRGHRNCICKDCQKLPKEERERIDIQEELGGYAFQSNISQKNIERLTELVGHEHPAIREEASALLEIAKVLPRRKKRWRRLVVEHFALFRRYMQATGRWEDREFDDLFGGQIPDEILEKFYPDEHSRYIPFGPAGDAEFPSDPPPP